MAAVLDVFIPAPDIRERHAILVHAPAELVFDVARHFDLGSLPLVRAMFWLRARLMGARGPAAGRQATADIGSLLQMGWGLLTDEPGRFFAAGPFVSPGGPMSCSPRSRPRSSRVTPSRIAGRGESIARGSRSAVPALG
jgi:hypothetical protein